MKATTLLLLAALAGYSQAVFLPSGPFTNELSRPTNGVWMEFGAAPNLMIIQIPAMPTNIMIANRTNLVLTGTNWTVTADVSLVVLSQQRLHVPQAKPDDLPPTDFLPFDSKWGP